MKQKEKKLLFTVNAYTNGDLAVEYNNLIIYDPDEIAYTLFQLLHNCYINYNSGLTFDEWKEKVYKEVKNA